MQTNNTTQQAHIMGTSGAGGRDDGGRLLRAQQIVALATKHGITLGQATVLFFDMLRWERAGQRP